MRFSSYALITIFMLSACHVSPENSYYTLNSDNASQYPIKNKGIALAKVSIPDVLDRPQMVMQTNRHEIHILEYKRWAEPFEDMVYRILSDDLTLQQTGNHKEKTHLTANRGVTVTIDQFMASEDGQVTLKASWIVGNKTTSGTSRYIFKQSVKTDADNVNAVASSMSTLLNALANAILTQTK